MNGDLKVFHAKNPKFIPKFNVVKLIGVMRDFKRKEKLLETINIRIKAVRNPYSCLSGLVLCSI